MRKTLILVGVVLGLAFSQPKSTTKAMLLCVIPGGGQFYTHRYINGVLIAGGEITLGYFAYQLHTEHRESERNSLLWYLAFVAGYSLADAYVGAKMFNFKVECDVDQLQSKLSLGLEHRW
jgi:hypothetical protein